MGKISLAVTIPAMLCDCTGGFSQFNLEAATLDQALQTLCKTYPLLRIHIFDEAWQVRPHIQIFYNQISTRWLESLDVPLKPGDRMAILQAVSGG